MTGAGAVVRLLGPRGAERLARLGCDDALALLDLGDDEGDLVNAHRDREVRRLGEGDDALFLKRHDGAVGAQIEWDAIASLREAGIATAEPVALVVRSGGTWRSALVTATVLGGRPLDEALVTLPPAERRAVVRATADLVRRLHDAGFRFPDLLARHLLLRADGTPVPIDLERLTTSARVSVAARGADLAVLDVSSRLAGATVRDRVRFLRAYLGLAPLGATGRALAGAVEAARRRIARKRRFHRHRLRVEPAHRDALAAAGLVEFGDFLAGGGATEIVRRLPDRTNIRVETPDGAVYFGKRVPPHRIVDVFLEWRRLDEFRRAGLPGPPPAAVGTDPVDGGFLLTAEVPGRPLDDWLREGALDARERLRIATDLGRLVRRMHDAGFFHRDLYLCHVFAAREDDGSFRLSIIDLGRAGRAHRPRKRWFVKDLAALLHSVPEGIDDAAAAAAFVRAYTGQSEEARSVKGLVRRVQRKARRMARHVPKHDGAGRPREA